MRLGIFGGTFSPPHIGHVRAAEALSAVLSPDKFMIIVDNLPPHKELDGGANADQRLAMANLAFGHIPNVASSLHRRRMSPSTSLCGPSSPAVA